MKDYLVIYRTPLSCRDAYENLINFFECFQQNHQLLLTGLQVYSFSHRGTTPHQLKIISEEMTMKSIKTFVAVAALS
ncbi:hypothetical protein, partial [Pantoea sp.]|uniref:hypothetical protein n=1 Tax=Pantoea sp. TaxID=69393 RepID=UPI0028B13C4D